LNTTFELFIVNMNGFGLVANLWIALAIHRKFASSPNSFILTTNSSEVQFNSYIYIHIFLYSYSFFESHFAKMSSVGGVLYDVTKEIVLPFSSSCRKSSTWKPGGNVNNFQTSAGKILIWSTLCVQAWTRGRIHA
jgi:hypothetical protein